MQKVKLFNPESRDSVSELAVIGGSPTGIANLNNIVYDWTKATYRKMIGNFWVPQKVGLTQDRITIKELSEDEMEALENNLSLLIYLDNYQSANLPNISTYISNPEIRNLLLVHQFQEVVHSESYQYVLESLFSSEKRDEIYNKWRTNPALLKRNQSIARIGQQFADNPTLENFYFVLVANLALEAIYFYQGFNFFDQLAHRNRLTETDKIIDYIRNDEMTHRGLFINIIKSADVPKWIIEKVIRDAVAEEIEWCKSCYGNRILGISENSSEMYVKWLGNTTAEAVGVQRLFEDVKNPYSHIETSKKSGKTRGNFFEDSAITDYDVADTVDGWDDL